MQLESSVTHRKQTIRQIRIDTKLARTARPSPRGNYRSPRIHRFAVSLESRITPHQSRITLFAHAPNLCETRAMRKLPNIAICVLATTFIFAGTATAQQTPATNPSSTPAAASAPAAGDSSAPPAKKPAKPAAKPAAAAAGKTQNADATQPAAKPAGSAQSSTPAKTQTGTAAKTPAGAAAQHHAAAAPLVLKTDKDKESYAIGLNIGKSIHRDGVEVDPNILSRGIKDALSDGKPALTDDEAKAVMTSLQTRLRKQQAEKAQVAAEAAKKVGEADKVAGDAFLAENKTKDGVVTLPSGLQYKILTEGTGPKPTATDTVVCNYKGTLLDNTEFDSSYKRNQPLTIPVGGVIKGWTEALQLMPVGSKWQLFIPSDLAYGPTAKGPIPPNSTLIFEVELLSIQEKKEPAK
jgi:FKBP-type peptidyl-prolyl cis-trans isomerase FklB